MAETSKGLGNWMRQLMSRRGFVFLMVVSSIALSVASFYTTFEGMTQYMRVWWVTALITFGLQGTMFAMAWIISNMLGTGARNVALMLVTFAICAFVSIVFSFASLFGQIYTGEMRDQVNSGYVRSFYQDAVVKLDQELEQETLNRHRALISSDDFVEWQTNVSTVIQVARSAPDVLRRRTELALADLELTIQTEQTEIASLEAQLAVSEPNNTAAREDIERLTRDIAALRETITELEKTQSDLEAEIAQLESEMELERSGVGSAAGEGPKFRRLRDERDAKVREKAGVDARLSGQQRRLKTLSDQERDLQAGLVSGASDKARLAAEIETRKRALEDAQARLNGLQAEGGGDLDSIVTVLQRNLRQAQRDADRVGDTVATVLGACTTLYDELQNEPDLNEALGDARCNTSTFQSEVNDVDEWSGRLVDFRASCAPGANISGDDNQTMFNTFVAKIEACLSKSALPVQGVREDLTQLIGSRGPDAHPFVVAENALFEDRQPLSYMAFILALIIDCLILLAALLANFVSKSRREKALRALLHVDFSDNGAAYCVIERSNPLFKTMEEEAVQLQLAGHGRYHRSADGGPNRLEFFSGAQQYLTQEISGEMGVQSTSVQATAPQESVAAPRSSFP